jgi:hypothetical protein
MDNRLKDDRWFPEDWEAWGKPARVECCGGVCVVGSWWLRSQPLLILTTFPYDCDLHISFITKRIVLQSYRLPSLYRRHIFLHPPLSLHLTKCPLYGGILVKLSHVANGLGSTLCNLQSYHPPLRTWSVYFYN